MIAKFNPFYNSFISLYIFLIKMSSLDNIYNFINWLNQNFIRRMTIVFEMALKKRVNFLGFFM